MVREVEEVVMKSESAKKMRLRVLRVAILVGPGKRVWCVENEGGVWLYGFEKSKKMHRDRGACIRLICCRLVDGEIKVRERGLVMHRSHYYKL